MIIQAKSNFYGIIGFNGLINLSSLSSMGVSTTDPLESQAFSLFIKPSQVVTVDDKWYPLQNIQIALSNGYITISNYPSIILSPESHTNVYSLTKLAIINTPDYPKDEYAKYNENFDILDASISNSGGGGTWGTITGELNNQTDLKENLDSKANIIGQTFTGNIYALNLSGVNTGNQDLSGLVPKTTTVNGHALSSNVTVTKTDIGLSNVQNVDTATTSNITDSSNKRFVTDSNLAVLANTSNVNSGDQDLSPYALIGANVSSFANDAGYLITFTEVDPVFTASNAFNITANDIINIHNLPVDLSGLVPKTTTVNGYLLSSNVIVTNYDIGLGAVANVDTTTTSNITDSSNKRFVTDLELLVLANTSNVNTGDQFVFDGGSA